LQPISFLSSYSPDPVQPAGRGAVRSSAHATRFALSPIQSGREEIVPVIVRDGFAQPVASKSGLITTLAGTDGFIRIPRELEGLREGDLVQVTLFSR